jgi:transcriptional regulator with XRE-family HTH domain
MSYVYYHNKLDTDCNLIQLYAMNDCVKFGDFIRSMRLRSNVTAREASQAAGMLPSNFSKLEHGAFAPPRDPAKQRQLAAAIGLSPESHEENEFFDLAAKAAKSVPVDLADIISKDDAVPLLLRTIGNKRLSKADIERLIEIVRGTSNVSKKP